MEFLSNNILPFHLDDYGGNYAFLGIKMGANVKINKNWKLNFSIESSIIKWFDGNVLGPEENNIFATIIQFMVLLRKFM